MNKIISDLTLNWHVEQSCNMHCRNCFMPRFKQLSVKENLFILSKVASNFSRINIVGGEPTLMPSLFELSETIREWGCIPSIVTNGYRMATDPVFASEVINNFDYIGLSVDSLKSSTNYRIGRSVGSHTLGAENILALCRKIKSSGKMLKINTVVSRYNLDENFQSFYKEANPDKIKLFQVLMPNLNLQNNYSDMLISKAEFEYFVSRYRNFRDILYPENNEMMSNSYYILNSEGCFTNNVTGEISRSLAEPGVSIKAALDCIDINLDRYKSRYEQRYSA